jgi:hypothetical protein
MHCTGFEFAYCRVLPAYNSILAQVIKTQDGNDGFAELLEGDPNLGKDGLGRETVLRDPGLDRDGNFKKYVLKYEHEAQPRNDGNGKPQISTLISNEEGNSLLAWNTVFDSAALNRDGSFVTGDYHGAKNVVLGDATITTPPTTTRTVSGTTCISTRIWKARTAPTPAWKPTRSAWVYRAWSSTLSTAVPLCTPWDLKVRIVVLEKTTS